MNKAEFYRAADGLIRIGRVSSVDVENRTARVIYEDRGTVSGNLKVLDNHPYITVSAAFKGSAWDCTASYTTIDRGDGYTYSADAPDTISLSSTYGYEMQCTQCDAGTEEASHTLYFEIHPWLPKIDDQVLVLLMPGYDAGGVILGGL